MAQSIEEFLVKIGVDSSQASKINDVINTLTNLANSANSTAQELTQSIAKTGDASDKAMANIEKGADKAKSKVSILKAAFIGFVAGAVLYGNRIASAFNNAIANAGNLLNSKNTLFKASQTELIQARQYQREMDRTKLSISSVATKIALNLAPNLTRAANGFNNWLSANKELVANGITAVVKALGWVIQLIVNVSRFINKIITSTIGWKNALIGLAIVWAAFNTALLFSPLGIIIGLVIALALAIDDLMVYLDGGKSAFGEYWEPLIKWINKSSNILKSFGTDWKHVLGAIGSLIGIIAIDKKLEKWGVSFKSVSKIIGNEIGHLKGAFNALKTVVMTNPILTIITAIAVAAYLIYNNWDFLVGFFSNLWSNIKSFFSDGIRSILMYFGMSEDGATNTVNAIGDAFNLVINLITAPFKAAWNFVKSLFNIWTDDSTKTVDKIGKSFSAVGDLITAPFKEAKAWIMEHFEKYINKVKNGWNSFKSFFGFGGDNDENINKLEAFSSASTAPSVAGNQMTTTTNSKQQSVTNNINMNQNINTPDPVEAGKQVAASMTDAVNQATASSKTAFTM